MTSFLSTMLWLLPFLFQGVLGGTYSQVSDWGNNPTGLQMFTYIPSKLASSPAVILALHPCGGSAEEYYTLTQLPSYADQLGFILIYPQTTNDENCWDVNTQKSLTHNGGGDSTGLAAMVQYILTTYNGDSSAVFAAGSSSGAMMTNVLASTYPNVFNAGAAFSGVPARCLENATNSAPGGGNSQTCVDGYEQLTQAEWGQLALAGYPGYTGPRTRMQIWSGTADTLVMYPTFSYALEQWSYVLGVSFSHNNTNTPQSGYTEEVYGDGTQLQGYSAAGVGHFVPFHEQAVLTFFGLLGSTASTSPAQSSATPTPTTRSPTSPTQTQSPISTAVAQKYGQCGGLGWTGPTTCAAGSTCTVSNEYYSQCL